MSNEIELSKKTIEAIKNIPELQGLHVNDQVFAIGAISFALKDEAVLSSIKGSEWVNVNEPPSVELHETVECVFKEKHATYGELFHVGYFRKIDENPAFCYVRESNIKYCQSYMILRRYTYNPNQ